MRRHFFTVYQYSFLDRFTQLGLFDTRTVFQLFVCGFFVPLKKFFTMWRRHHCRWRASTFDLCSALMVIEQWGFLNVPNLLWHGQTFYNGHHWGPMSLTPVAERLAIELSLSMMKRPVIEPRSSACKASAIRHCNRGVRDVNKSKMNKYRSLK